ncbi:MAG TPA: Crp/Fnr family transcriptional regulator [Vicinamibacterales bacterium]|nr:Crp/Fnr family transcriptional regulator [Vicinamibacterales bacterium]
MPVNGNRILASLPPDEYDRLRPHLFRRALTVGDILHPSKQPIDSVYFPFSGVCSFTLTMQDGRTVEVGTVGNEGIAGMALYYQGSFGESQTVVQVGGGEADGMRAGLFLAEMDRRGALHQLVQRYSQALVTLIMQSVACNALHDVPQRAARWLLMTHDRVGSDAFELTQEYLAAMLGVRRPTVTVIARELQNKGLITYQRRRIRITDRRGLERMSCECYGVVRKEFARLTP